MVIMPLYAFRCTCCCHEFDRLLSLRDYQSILRCPECGSEVRRLVSTFAMAGGRRSEAPLVQGGG
jgi:putative FmdB family regulatory protein